MKTWYVVNVGGTPPNPHLGFEPSFSGLGSSPAPSPSFSYTSIFCSSAACFLSLVTATPSPTLSFNLLYLSCLFSNVNSLLQVLDPIPGLQQLPPGLQEGSLQRVPAPSLLLTHPLHLLHQPGRGLQVPGEYKGIRIRKRFTVLSKIVDRYYYVRAARIGFENPVFTLLI